MSLSPLIVFGSNPSGNVEVPFASLSDEVLVTLASTTGMTEFAWTLLGKPSGSSVVAPSGSVSSFSFTPDYPGTYLFRVVVNDGDGVGEAFYAVLTEGVGIRIPAPKETTQAGASGWADSVNSALAVLSRLSGRGASVVCKNASGASMAKGVAVVLSESDDGEGRPSVILADASALESAPAGAAVFGISNGDPETGGSVADDGFVSVTFGPGFFFGVTVEGSTPASFPSPVTWGSAPGLLAYGDDPVVGSALADGFIAIAPSGADSDLRDLFAVDHDLDGETGYHKTVNQQGARADAEDTLEWSLLSVTHGPEHGLMRTYSLTVYDSGYEVTRNVTTYNAEFIDIDGTMYCQKDSILPSWMVSFGGAGVTLQSFASFDDAPTSPESAPTGPEDPTPVVFAQSRWKTIARAPLSETELLYIANDTLRIARGEFSGGIDLSTRVYPEAYENVDLGTENNRFRRVATDEVLMGEDGVTIRQGDGDPNDADPADTATAGSLRLSNDGTAYIRDSSGWRRVGLQDYVAQEVSSVSEPMIRAHPDFPGVLEAYIPATVKTRNGDTVYVKRPDGTSGLKPVKLVFKPGDGLVGTAVDGDGDLVDGTPWETAYPLTTAQAAVCTQVALGEGASACYSLQVNRLTGAIHLVRPLDTPVEESLMLCDPDTAASRAFWSLVDSTYRGRGICQFKNVSNGRLGDFVFTDFVYHTNNASGVQVKITLRAGVSDGDDYTPGELLGSSDTISLTQTPSTTPLVITADVPVAGNCDPGGVIFVCLEYVAGAAYFYRCNTSANPISIGKYVCPVYGEVKSTAPDTSWTIAATGANGYLGLITCNAKFYGSPYTPDNDANGDYQNIALIGQQSRPVEDDSTFSMDGFQSVFRGSSTVSGGVAPFAIIPSDVEGPTTLDVDYHDNVYYAGMTHNLARKIYINSLSGDTDNVRFFEHPYYDGQEIVVRQRSGLASFSTLYGNFKYSSASLSTSVNREFRLVGNYTTGKWMIYISY